MIPRRALVSLRQQSATRKTSNNNFISRFTTSSAPQTPNLNSNFSISQNQRRLSLRSLFSYSSSSSQIVVPTKHDFRVLGSRPLSTRSMNDSSNRPPKETIVLDGCDFEHWLVVMEPPDPNDPNITRDDIIDSYIKTLTQVLGSEEEARKQIYSVSTRHYFAFGCIVSEELSYKIKELPRVRWVLPDSYLDVRNKSYGGEPFVDGQAVPYDPKYHEEWVRNNARANERSKRSRNDRPRNFDRRRDNMNSGAMPPPPSSTPNPNFRNQGAPNQDMRPPTNQGFQNQVPPANQGFQNQGPPPTNQGFQNQGPPSANQGFQNQGPPPSANQGFQNQAPPPANQGFQNQSPPYRNQDFANRGPPPPVQNRDFQNRDIPPPMHNQGFQNSYQPPPQGQGFQNRDVPPPMQNQGFQGRNMAPPPPPPPAAAGNWNYQNRDTPHQQQSWNHNGPPPTQNREFQSPPVQNQDFQNRIAPPPPGHNRDFEYREMGNVPNRDMGPGFMPNRDHQSGNGPALGNMNAETPNADYQNVVNRNF